ncbi:MAG: hypothetical protein HN478_11830 [Rhodospirillaceae bacterium]|nr:hypothetical protein [Rhodospirillaceae bacterium]MBT4491067.1 hypothetical protein [Rhodospirillaceae bacterium]MBT5193375.1 hypothetical protein [Rhodospirillaceae bacterium]MBT5895242.1 hypothetical protein [Rhodospirillaceae bacterium]MBT6430885.1 hypothetical protein [Rhodospirillaceae bacterium]
MNQIKFLREQEIPASPGDTVFRQGMWRNAIACAVSTTIAAAFLASPHLPPIFGWDPNGGLALAYIIGGIVGLLAWFTWRAVIMARAPTNWVMRLAPNGLYLRYRSYLNGDFPGEPVAAFIPGGAIAWIGPVVEKSRRIDSEGSTIFETHRRLEIKLREAGLDEFKRHLAHERKRQIPSRFGTKGVFRHYPVRAVGDDTIQLDWRDTQTATVPRLKVATAILARRYPSRPLDSRRQPDAADLDRQGQENQIISLVEAGEVIQAVKLTKRLYGLSTTDAKAFIDDLS